MCDRTLIQHELNNIFTFVIYKFFFEWISYLLWITHTVNSTIRSITNWLMTLSAHVMRWITILLILLMKILILAKDKRVKRERILIWAHFFTAVIIVVVRLLFACFFFLFLLKRACAHFALHIITIQWMNLWANISRWTQMEESEIESKKKKEKRTKPNWTQKRARSSLWRE